MSVAEPDAACPLCGRPLRDEPCDDDHVFGQAFGGRVTVRTHKSCNSRYGGEEEGALHRPNTLLSMIRAARGLKAPPMRATARDGTAYDVDLSRGTAEEARPVVRVEHDSESIRLSVRGSERSVKRVLKSWRKRFGSAIPRYSDLPDDVKKELIGSPTEMKSVLAHDLTAARTVALNTAIKAGVVVYGPAFADTPLAAALRDRRDEAVNAASSSDVLATGAMVASLDGGYADMAGKYESSGLKKPQLPSLEPAEDASDVILLPYKNQTIVYVRILGVPLIDGLVVAAPMQRLNDVDPVAPVLVRESSTDRFVVDYTRELLDPVIEQAESDAARLRANDEGEDG